MTGNRFQTYLLLVLFFCPLSIATASLGKSTLNDDSLNILKPYLHVCAHEKTAASATHEKKLFIKRDHRSVMVSCGFSNHSNRSISAIKGVLRFTTYFGQPVFEMPLREKLSLEPGQETLRDWTLQRDDFKDEEAFAAFMTTPLSRLRQEWTPEELVLADGTVLKP